MKGVGIDIVDLRRIRGKEEKFLGILSPKEKSLYEKAPDKASFLGGRFAAKEAYMKALGKGLSLCRMEDIEVLYEEGGAPYLLHEGKRHLISISHDGDYAVAVAYLC